MNGATSSGKTKSLGVGTTLRIVSGYYRELTVTGDLTPHQICWFISIASFRYMVQESLVGLSEDGAAERHAVPDGLHTLSLALASIMATTMYL